MKKIILIMLVAMVPILTMAQKRSKKNKTETTNASYEFMIITGEMITPAVQQTLGSSGNSARGTAPKIRVSFDFGSPTNTLQNLEEQQYRSMAHAVNTVAKQGWQFVNANVVNSGNSKITHYYYMRKEK